jgi:hypothetical protein
MQCNAMQGRTGQDRALQKSRSACPPERYNFCFQIPSSSLLVVA